MSIRRSTYDLDVGKIPLKYDLKDVDSDDESDADIPVLTKQDLNVGGAVVAGSALAIADLFMNRERNRGEGAITCRIVSCTVTGALIGLAIGAPTGVGAAPGLGIGAIVGALVGSVREMIDEHQSR